MKRLAAVVAALVLLAVIGVLTAYVPVRRDAGKAVPPATSEQRHGGKLLPPTLAIMASINGGPWTKADAIYPLKGQKVSLRIAGVSGGTIRWYQIAPDISQIYKNASHPWEPNPYKWVGFAKMDYTRKELIRFRGQSEIEPFAAVAASRGGDRLTESLSMLKQSTTHCLYYHNDVGSFWFQAEVEKQGKIRRSHGVEDSDKRGLSPRVFRVSVRDGQGYVGYLTSFFNVPGLFGSIPYQSNNYIGVDCCDVLVAAYGMWSGHRFEKDYSVSMLVSKLPKVTECEVVDGKPDRQIQWGKDIRPGHLIAVRYAAGKPYQHIGALHSDADKDGALSEKDFVLHAGPQPLRYSTLGDGLFDGHVMILYPKLSSLATSDHKLVQFAREMLYLFR